MTRNAGNRALSSERGEQEFYGLQETGVVGEETAKPWEEPCRVMPKPDRIGVIVILCNINLERA